MLKLSNIFRFAVICVVHSGVFVGFGIHYGIIHIPAEDSR